MKHSALSSLSVLSLLIGTLTLVGCGGAFSMPDSVVSSSAAASGPSIQGSVFGGHAPIQGAHVYLLQPSTTAYGGVATSLLNNNATATNASGSPLVDNSNGFPLTKSAGADGSFTNGSYYVKTDNNGAFNLTGYYSCTPQQPVYIYAYGGNIGTIATSPTTISLNITSATANRAGGVTTYTFTAANANPVPLVAGNTVTLALTGGTNWGTLPASETVATANSTGFTVTSTTNLHITGTATGTATYTFTTTGNTSPTTNNNIVQLATLGDCPKNGVANFGSNSNNPINFVYLNEVSTIATAYTFQPFTLSTNNDAWHIGTTGGTQALLGIENAAATAAQLYDIQGGQDISTSGDGEGHLANIQTVGAGGVNHGLGLVPQATIDSLANIIAACVDSVPVTVGTPTTQCNALFSIARNDGTTAGTKPIDTGTAAINIARFPAGNHSSSPVDATFVTDLFAIPTTTVPYVPALSNAPNDWTIAIDYSYAGQPGYTTDTISTLGRAESIAVDDLGQIWITAQTNTDVVRWSPLGADNAVTNNLGYIPGYVSVDGFNNAYTGNANDTAGTAIYEAGYNGSFHATYGSGYQKAYVNIADSAGDDYFFAATSSTGGNYEMFEFPYGSTGATVPNEYSISPSVITAGDNEAHGAIDASGDFWLTTENPGNQIARVSSTGVAAFTTINTVEQPEFPAIDSNGNAWIPIQQTAGEIYHVTPTGTATTLTATTTGAELTSTFGAAVDGNGNVWVTNRSGNYGSDSGDPGTNTVVVLNGFGPSTATTGTQVGAGTPGTVDKAISPPTNYYPETQFTGTTLTPLLNDSLNIAIDPSGNVWVTNYLGSAVVEIVGAAAPVVTPLSVAAHSGKLGQKPN